MANDILNQIEREYSLIREKNQNRSDAVLSYARRDKDFRENEAELKTITQRIARAESFDENFELAESLKEKKKSLLAARDAIIKRLKLSSGDFEKAYTCRLCKDTGYVSNKPCQCFKEKWKKYFFASLDISPTPSIDFSCDTAIKSKRSEKFYDAMRRYVEVFPKTNTNNFLFIGNTGCGKTYLASMMAGELSKKGFNCIFLTATELNQLFLKMHLAQYSERVDYMSVLISCDFLVIDDLGAENIYKNVTVEYLLALISERLAKKKHTVITSNLNGEEIMDRYNERFFSRVTEKLNSATVVFDDVNFRLKKIKTT